VPIDAGKLVADTGKVNDYRYYLRLHNGVLRPLYAGDLTSVKIGGCGLHARCVSTAFSRCFSLELTKMVESASEISRVEAAV